MIHGRVFLGVVVLVVLCSSPAFAAKKKTTTAPAPGPPTPGAPTSRPDSSVLAAAAPLGVALTPGPLVTPGSPVAQRTTIAPFPVPGDTSRVARERSKQMNAPRAGLTLTGPLPSEPDVSEIRFIGPFKGGLYVPYRGGVFELPEHVGVLPEPLTQPAPEYPKAAIGAHIQGTVMVMAHVLTDGTVGPTWVMRSIPALDSAAVQSVKRMRFRPASIQGKPVAVWVGVPVRFTLH